MPTRSPDSAHEPAGGAERASPAGARAEWQRIGVAVLGAMVGGLVGAFLVVGVTLVLKAGMDFGARQATWYVVVVPLLGLVVATLALQGFGVTARAGGPQTHPWRTFPSDAVRADISSDVIDSAGQEERFPWRLAPIRALAILATVGSGAAMGTEAPAAYLGVAAGAWVGDRGRRWRALLRPAALAGGAAGVAALMAIPLVGTAFMLELGRRRGAPLSVERIVAALIGGVVGWEINELFNLSLIRLVVPHEPPLDLRQAAAAALLIGALSGVISSLAGLAVNRAKKWKAPPAVRLALAGAATFATALVLARLLAPSAAIGPGTGAIVWAESAGALPMTLLAVCILRAVATTAAAAAGGCGGVFVPFLAVGDIAGRVFAPGLGVGSDLAGAAGAAGGIAAGYRLPFTAVAMVFGVGGPPRATVTCLVTVAVAYYAGVAVELALEKAKALFQPGRPRLRFQG